MSPDEATTPPLELLFGTILGLTILGLAVLAFVALVELLVRLLGEDGRARRAKRRAGRESAAPRIVGRL